MLGISTTGLPKDIRIVHDRAPALSALEVELPAAFTEDAVHCLFKVKLDALNAPFYAASRVAPNARKWRVSFASATIPPSLMTEPWVNVNVEGHTKPVCINFVGHPPTCHLCYTCSHTPLSCQRRIIAAAVKPSCWRCKSSQHVQNNCPFYKCFRCDGQGHRKSDCPKCTVCHKYGHTNRHCPSEQRAPASAPHHPPPPPAVNTEAQHRNSFAVLAEENDDDDPRSQVDDDVQVVASSTGARAAKKGRRKPIPSLGQNLSLLPLNHPLRHPTPPRHSQLLRLMEVGNE